MAVTCRNQQDTFPTILTVRNALFVCRCARQPCSAAAWSHATAAACRLCRHRHRHRRRRLRRRSTPRPPRRSKCRPLSRRRRCRSTQQPPCPEDGYLWTPGYWAFTAGGYYWVPGTWVAPPRVGVLWTPGYWGFVGGVYLFHAGLLGAARRLLRRRQLWVRLRRQSASSADTGPAKPLRLQHGRGQREHDRDSQHLREQRVTVNNVTVNRVSYNGGAGGVGRAAHAAGARGHAGAACSADAGAAGSTCSKR